VRLQHLKEIEVALLDGVPQRQIVEEFAAKYSITHRQVYHDIKQVERWWERASEQIRAGNHSQCSIMRAAARREALYHACLKSGERRDALAAEQDRCRLLGLYEQAVHAKLDDFERRLMGLGDEGDVETTTGTTGGPSSHNRNGTNGSTDAGPQEPHTG
jgi:hypothetical protein